MENQQIFLIIPTLCHDRRYFILYANTSSDYIDLWCQANVMAGRRSGLIIRLQIMSNPCLAWRSSCLKVFTLQNGLYYVNLNNSNVLKKQNILREKSEYEKLPQSLWLLRLDYTQIFWTLMYKTAINRNEIYEFIKKNDCDELQCV